MGDVGSLGWVVDSFILFFFFFFFEIEEIGYAVGESRGVVPGFSALQVNL